MRVKISIIKMLFIYNLLHIYSCTQHILIEHVYKALGAVVTYQNKILSLKYMGRHVNI